MGISVVWSSPRQSFGPILFLIYINDIGDAIRNLLWLFADDTKLFGCTNTATDIEDLELDKDEPDNWSDNWLLKFNVDKSLMFYLVMYGYNNPNHTYAGCSNMNASSFITFFTYMLRQNVIPFLKELFVAFKIAPT